MVGTVRHVKEHGHCSVPNNHVSADGYLLGRWVSKRRRRQDMPAEQRSLLSALGFIWHPLTAKWEKGFEHLQEFAKEHGHCRVPRKPWVQYQRRNQHHLSRVSAEQRSRLDTLNFIWDEYAARWKEGFRHLQAFARESGHCKVPDTYKTADGYQLGGWVQHQRRRQTSLLPEQKTSLDVLGFIWDPLTAQWEKVTGIYNRLRESVVTAGCHRSMSP
jgi:hypothetical protein